MEVTPGFGAPTPVLLWTNSMSKNATPSVNSDGHDDSIDHELHTDGGVSRRVFLGAAATLSALPVAGGATAAEDTGGDESARTADESTDYGYSNVVDTSGGLDLHVGTDGNYETSVTVSSHPEGVGLKLSNEVGTMSVLLLPKDIEPLCRELLDARAKTREDDVEYSREWITEEFRGGDV
jgi:hypothetical protein